VETLDAQLPAYDVNEVHALVVDAPPAEVLAAARELTPRDVPLLVLLSAVRSLPAILMGRRRLPRGTILDGFHRLGFVALEDGPRRLAFGGIGRFWTVEGGMRRIEPAEFEGFAEPGYAKAAFDFSTRPDGAGRTILSTETRVLATDEHARRCFRRYWRLIHPGSAAIRIAWLRAIRGRAESGAQAARPASASSRRSTSSGVV
jgi:hypothetical protein